MHWVTARRIKINRAATAWLIRTFVDPQAEFVFVEPRDVAAEAQRLGRFAFHARSAKYPPPDANGRTPFEALVEECCPGDPALRRMSEIIRDADVPRVDGVPGAAGVRLISGAFPLVAKDDYETVERTKFLYDSMCAALKRGVGA